MKTRTSLVVSLILAGGLPMAMLVIGRAAGLGRNARPPGPCDIYAAGGTPCVTAHSTTRALYATYRGPLYQVMRESDGKKSDIGLMAGSGTEEGGYADAAAQDVFCANTLCFITVIYDQSGKGNHLYQAPPGTFKGPAPGGFDTLAIADMAPVTVGGHKVYGVFIMPGMGYRNNGARDLAINDEPQGVYYVVDGTHYDSGCCFDYGNASANGRAVGTGTMETAYFGNATAWGSGAGPGPWIEADMEAGVFSGYSAKQNVADPTINSWRFVTAVVDGGGGNQWDLRGGDAQKGKLTTFYSGVRPGSSNNSAYFPMHKKGGVLLGNGGDNGNGSSGTFYEGVMTTGYPSEATTDAVQANIVAARYDVQRLSVSALTPFAVGAAQDVTVSWKNVGSAAIKGVKLSVTLPGGWKAEVAGAKGNSKSFAEAVAPEGIVSAVFQVTSPAKIDGGYMSARAEWLDPEAGGKQTDTIAQRVRSVYPVRINEVRLGAQYIELYNASEKEVSLSGWRLKTTPSQWATVPVATIPSGTKLAAHGFYLLGQASSGLAAPAGAGATKVNLRSTAGFAAGQKIDIDGESRSIVSVGSGATAATTIFIPVSTGPWTTFPAGTTNLPVASAVGYVVGEKIGIDVGGQFELATVTSVGMAGTQTTLSAATAAGASSIKLAAAGNVQAGDTVIVGSGQRKEMAKVVRIDADGVKLAGLLKFDHILGAEVSDVGTGISFSPATRFSHVSGEAVQALGSGVVVDRPLVKAHENGAPVVNAEAPAGGYQGPPEPNQWFGNALSTSAGSISLWDAGGNVVIDAMVYGSRQSSSSANGTLTSPELAVLAGNQSQGGCIVVAPAGGRGGGRGATPAIGVTNRSMARVSDGLDTGSECSDFQLQAPTPGAANQKNQ